MTTAQLDDIDRQILDLLQRDARITNAAIAAEVGLTAPSVFERVRKLEQREVIQGYTINIDPAALGKPMTAFIRLTAAFDDRYDAGVKAVSEDPDVLECYNVAGEDCLVLKIKCGSPSDLERLLGRIRSRLTVQRSVTMIALRALKENAPLNVLPQPEKPAAKRAKK
ncbi:MAG TPA: Lrp/AsnC family transcriptional regulator [Anaerolineae bacterium]|nr:Lrp/AsnC family transcriptional regulator [Anaerolineae bacterium]